MNCNKNEQKIIKESIDQNQYCPKTMTVFINSKNKEFPNIWKCEMCNKYFLNQNSAQNHVSTSTKELMKYL